GSAWSFAGNAGLAGNGAFTANDAPAPQGTQVAFLQGAGSAISQAVNFTAGTYFLSFSAAQRATYNWSKQTFWALVDGSVVGTCTPSGTSYAAYTTAPFTVSAGTHTIAFVGLNPNGGDNTALIDQVAINL